MVMLLSVSKRLLCAMLRQDAGAQAQQKLSDDPGSSYQGHPTRLRCAQALSA
ncbi:hypothetical protein IG631_12144 [Alternaria alternata]|nr:hypothetical protein IG631_12144 [Alternaria alternata]